MAAVVTVGAVATVVPAAAELASPWTADKPETRARLVAGEADGRLVAGVEVGLAPGWKTYWRTPGDAGGIPPAFDWSASENVAAAEVRFPAPSRFAHHLGDSLGYGDAVTFPVVVTPRDPARPVRLAVAFAYAACKDVCIPVDAGLTLEVPATGRGAPPPTLTAALAAVPPRPETARPEDPRLLAVRLAGTAETPLLVIEAAFPGGTADADAFVEGPAEAYVPQPPAGRAIALGGDRLRFEIDLTGAARPSDLTGKSVTVTLVSARGRSETVAPL
jgi:DsbC/DsbD-like thiol-disulfide interchange protein